VKHSKRTPLRHFHPVILANAGIKLAAITVPAVKLVSGLRGNDDGVEYEESAIFCP
jgi:hypothetical protein